MSKPTPNLNYLQVDELIEFHDYAIEESGGLPGLKDRGLLESPLQHIQNDELYPTFYRKLAHLTFSVAKNHCFNDGNKRASIAASTMFMARNRDAVGDDFSIDNYVHSMEQVVIFVVENVIDKELLQLIQEFLLLADKESTWGFSKLIHSMDIMIQDDTITTDIIIATITKFIADDKYRQGMIQMIKEVRMD